MIYSSFVRQYTIYICYCGVSNSYTLSSVTDKGGQLSDLLIFDSLYMPFSLSKMNDHETKLYA